ncbi:MAG: hypothetical protein ACYTG0_31920 [Planctomycetota bacterium]|jgi:hypothetical protein
MSISFQCPNCGKRFKVRDDLAGKRAKCTCGNVMTIPKAAPSAAAPPPTPPVAKLAPQPTESFGSFLDDELKEPAPQTGPTSDSSAWEYDVSAPAAEMPRPTTFPRQHYAETTTTTSDDDDESGAGAVLGLVIFVLVFGVGNWILYSTTGYIIIPIPRR